MKFSLIIILCVISVYAPAQNVVIPANVARFYLEQDDRVNILTCKDSVNHKIIVDMNAELLVKQEIIITYKNDSVTMREIITTKEREIFHTEEELIRAQQSLENKKIQLYLYKGAAFGAVVGSGIPAIGTFGGFAIGGVIGAVTYGVVHFKKFFKR